MAFPVTNGQTRKGERYDNEHRKARAAAAKQHHPDDPCSRCGEPLGPMSPHLHYDHHDDGHGYRGFSHATCNIRAGAREGNRRQRHTTTSPSRWVL